MIKTGIENISSVESILRGKRIGLMTNQTGVDRAMRSTIDILNEHCDLRALFACEHGVRGDAQAGVEIDARPDPETGTMVYSVFGKSHHLTDEMLDETDVFVFDMQDVGARFYTYLYSLSYAMQDCARAGKTVVVLDRPNPLGGEAVSGTLLEEKLHSFVGEYAMPTRYGMTIGEYALWVRDHIGLDLDMHIVPMTGWRRDMQYEDTGLCFVPPSPNCASLHAVRAYIGTCIFEGLNISEGRGTTLPFEYIGAPFIDAAALTRRMNALELPGILFRRAYFTPQFGKYAGEQCAGVQLHLTDPSADAFAAGLYLLDEMLDMHSDKIEWNGADTMRYPHFDLILGTDAYRLGKTGARQLIAEHREKILKWQEDTRRYHLYL